MNRYSFLAQQDMAFSEDPALLVGPGLSDIFGVLQYVCLVRLQDVRFSSQDTLITTVAQRVDLVRRWSWLKGSGRIFDSATKSTLYDIKQIVRSLTIGHLCMFWK